MRKEGQIVRRVLVIIPRCKCVDFSHRGGVADPMPPKNRPRSTDSESPRGSTFKASKTSSGFSADWPSSSTVPKRIASSLNQLEWLVPELMFVAAMGKFFSNGIFQTWVVVTVRLDPVT